jgi:MFS family permease
MAFSLLYGSVGGWFLSLLPVVAAQLFGPHNLATIVGFATLCNAPGQFAAGSIGGALKERFDWQALILFSGCAMSGGSTLILYGTSALRLVLRREARILTSSSTFICRLVARFKANKKLWAKV